METILAQAPDVGLRRSFRRKRKVIYPDSDGKPMSQNPKQYRMIVLIESNLAYWYAKDPNVWIGKDQNWYPVLGAPKTVQAPDVFVVFGRSNDERSTYQQWLEDNVAPQIVIEVLSPSNTKKEMTRKLGFYERHGAEEYYIIDPDFRLVKKGLEVYLRNEVGELVPQKFGFGFCSPRMGVLFTVSGREFEFFHPNGEPFISPAGLRALHEEAERKAATLAKELAEQTRAAETLAQELAEQTRAAETLARELEDEQTALAEQTRAAETLARELEEEQKALVEQTRAAETLARELEGERLKRERYEQLLREKGIEF